MIMLKILSKLLKIYNSHKKLTYIISTLLIISIIYGVFFYNKNTNVPEIKVVEVKPATFGSIKQSIRLIGTIKAKKSTIFTAKDTGIVEKIIDSGQKANKGDLVVKLENADLERSYQLSEDAAKVAREQYERHIIAANSNIISKKELDKVKEQWITAQKNLTDTKLKLDQTKFIAPFAGIVGMYKIREGTQVAQGEQIVAFFDPNELVVEFDIPATVLNQIHDGQSVIIGNKHLHINHIQKMVDPDTNMSPAVVDYHYENCFMGENIDVDLIIAEKDNTLIVPTSAVFLKNGIPAVYVVEDNKAILKPITTGLQEKQQIEITEGIKENDLIIINGQARLYPFAKVKIFQEKPPPANNP